MFGKLGLGMVAAVSAGIICFKYYHHNFYRKLFELEAVFEQERDFTPLSRLVLVKLMQQFLFAGGVLYWFDEAQSEFKLKTFHGIAGDKIGLLIKVLRHPQGILARLNREPEGFTLRDLGKERWVKRSGKLSRLTQLGHSLMAVPFRASDKTLGILVLFGKGSTIPRKYLKLFRTFGSRAAVHLDNARLYQLTRETAQENARLYLNLSRLYHQATSDELTGLYNRNFMMQRLREEVKKAWRFGQPLSLIFTDLDYFKRINDQYGHPVGDGVLKEFSRILKASIREYDIACRFGGEEFVIILPHTPPANAMELAERLRVKVANQPFRIEEYSITMTASFGIAALPPLQGTVLPCSEAIDEMIQEVIVDADNALYQAKRNGRNQVHPGSFLSIRTTGKSLTAVTQ